VREAPVPSYRVRSAANEGSSTRMLAMAGGLAAIVGVGAMVGWGITRLTTDRPIPTVEADARPVKIRPDDRGGLRVANQDEIIFERRGSGATFEASGRLAPAAEAPNLDALRAATAPPPAPAPRIVTENQAPVPASELPPVPALPGQPPRPSAPPPPAPQAAGSPLTAPQPAAPQLAAPQAPATPAARPRPWRQWHPPLHRPSAWPLVAPWSCSLARSIPRQGPVPSGTAWPAARRNCCRDTLRRSFGSSGRTSRPCGACGPAASRPRPHGNSATASAARVAPAP
jgi:hypothetical protein